MIRQGASIFPASGFTRPTAWWTWLVLGRVSNLPTVWSNCLAGWLLAGGGSGDRLALLILGATGLYLGGMFLNDAFDARFDRQYRPERPIPSGAISERAVWLWGSAWLGLGMAALAPLGWTPFLLAIGLAGCILLYDAVHKQIHFAPLLIAACRFLLYLVAGAAAHQSLLEAGSVIWSGLVLAAYVTGLSYLARRESFPGSLRHWPLLFLGAPLLLAAVVNLPTFWVPTLAFSVVFLGWVLWSLRHTLWSAQPRIGRTVAGLLAGIVLVDALAVLGGGPLLTPLFVALFLLALLMQRYVPAT